MNEFQLVGDLMKFDKADYKGERRVLFDLSALAESPTFKSFPTCKISQSRLKLHHMKYSKEEDFSLPIFASYHRIPPLSFSKKSTFFSFLPHFLSPPRPTDPLLIRFPATVLLPSHQMLPPSDQMLPPSGQMIPPSYQFLSPSDQTFLQDQTLLRDQVLLQDQAFLQDQVLLRLFLRKITGLYFKLFSTIVILSPFYHRCKIIEEF